MKRLDFTYRTSIKFEFPAIDHSFSLRYMPRPSRVQRLLACEISLTPDVAWSLQKDGFGNLMQIGTCRAPHDSISFVVSGAVSVDLSRRQEEDCHPSFRCPSPLTWCSPELMDFARAHDPGPDRTPLERGIALMEAVNDRIVYTPRSTTVDTTAAQAFALGKGVCQDESHVLIALCRYLGIPARYCCGLTVGEGATHAWVEVWSGGMWYGLDPTRRQQVDETYLVIAVGRDYYACPVDRGVLRGGGRQEQTVYMKVRES